MYPYFSVSQLMRQSQGPQEPGDGGFTFTSREQPYNEGGFSVGAPRAEAPRSTDWSTAGTVVSIAGSAAAAVGALYAVRSNQNAAKSQALSLEFEASMSALNARAAEREAQSIERGGEREAGAVQLQAAATKSSARAGAAARGVLVGAGSAGEIQASIDFVKEADVMAIGVNAARAAAAARTQGVNASNSALLAGVSARNARRNAGNDFTAASALSTSLLFSSGQIMSQLATDRRRGLQ